MFESTASKVRLMINEFRNVTDKETGKSFIVYCVEVVYRGEVTRTEKRFSEFYDLYRKLSKMYGTKYNFPAKHVLNRDNRVLESRRIGLESYLQMMLQDYEEEIPQLLLDFLQLDIVYDDELLQNGDETLADRVEQNDLTDAHHQTNLQSMITFQKDVYLEPTAQEHAEEKILSSIVIQGTLQAIYDSWFRLQNHNHSHHHHSSRSRYGDMERSFFNNGFVLSELADMICSNSPLRANSELM